jgi:hypothetical protein
MRNKVNRLEELFIRLVDGSASAGRASSASVTAAAALRS